MEIAEKHSAAAINMETEQAEDGDNYPLFDSGYPTVLTNTMLNAGKLRSMQFQPCKRNPESKWGQRLSAERPIM